MKYSVYYCFINPRTYTHIAEEMLGSECDAVTLNSNVHARAQMAFHYVHICVTIRKSIHTLLASKDANTDLLTCPRAGEELVLGLENKILRFPSTGLYLLAF